MEFDLSFDVPDCDAVLTDRLDDTVDYAEVCDIVALAATERSYRTLERLCQVVAGRLMERFDCESVRVRAAKPEPPVPYPVQEAAVEVTLDRAGDREGTGTTTRVGLRPQVRVGYIGLGSNVGEREEHLRRAIDDLRAHGIEVEAVSSGYETEPVGDILDQPDFLNAAVRIRTASSPRRCWTSARGSRWSTAAPLPGPSRAPSARYRPAAARRPGTRTERLTLPHREVTTRRFVLAPLLELDPELALPKGTPLASALAALPEEEQRADRVIRL